MSLKIPGGSGKDFSRPLSGDLRAEFEAFLIDNLRLQAVIQLVDGFLEISLLSLQGLDVQNILLVLLKTRVSASIEKS